MKHNFTLYLWAMLIIAMPKVHGIEGDDQETTTFDAAAADRELAEKREEFNRLKEMRDHNWAYRQKSWMDQQTDETQPVTIEKPDTLDKLWYSFKSLFSFNKGYMVKEKLNKDDLKNLDENFKNTFKSMSPKERSYYLDRLMTREKDVLERRQKEYAKINAKDEASALKQKQTEIKEISKQNQTRNVKNLIIIKNHLKNLNESTFTNIQAYVQTLPENDKILINNLTKISDSDTKELQKWLTPENIKALDTFITSQKSKTDIYKESTLPSLNNAIENIKDNNKQLTKYKNQEKALPLSFQMNELEYNIAAQKSFNQRLNEFVTQFQDPHLMLKYNTQTGELEFHTPAGTRPAQAQPNEAQPKPTPDSYDNLLAKHLEPKEPNFLEDPLDQPQPKPEAQPVPKEQQPETQAEPVIQPEPEEQAEPEAPSGPEVQPKPDEHFDTVFQRNVDKVKNEPEEPSFLNDPLDQQLPPLPSAVKQPQIEANSTDTDVDNLLTRFKSETEEEEKARLAEKQRLEEEEKKRYRDEFLSSGDFVAEHNATSVNTNHSPEPYQPEAPATNSSSTHDNYDWDTPLYESPPKASGLTPEEEANI